ncbi:hypothetical protein BTVI_149958 [Pitangus sulphuratus]|nr:hypothetical protein BTVI_149958 [Pitangus sulphuratus]
MLEAELKTGKAARKKYVIKQVECIEQYQANEALKEVSSLFLCLVMQHSGQGDLSALIKEKRQKSEKITDTAEEITSLLQDIRGDSSCLQGALTLVQNADNSYLPLLPILLMMLQIEPSMRPSAKDLVDVPFIKECLTFAGDTSVILKKSLPPKITDMLLEGGIESVLAFMQASWDVEEVQAKGIQHLASFVKDKSETAALALITDSKGSGIELIKDVYHLHFDDPGVVGAVCLLMKEMAQYDEVVLDMLSQKMDKLLSEIKIQFPFSTEITSLVDATLLKLQK